MNTLLRILKWALIFLVVLLAGLLTAAHWVTLRKSDQEIAESFHDKSVQPRVFRYRVNGRTIRYIDAHRSEADTNALPVVLFLHGAPSSLSFFDKFFRDSLLLDRARLVAVDRPGYGYSDFGRVETSIVRQAELLRPLIQRYRNAPFLMLVGSSYGGPLAAKLAMDNPSDVDHVVFVSSALGPGLERIYPISYWIDKPPLRWLIPQILLNANDEKLAHRAALKEIEQGWGRIRAGVTFLHGQRDDLVYPANVSYARQRLTNARVKEYLLPENRHDIVFNKREYMTDIILQVLARHAQPVVKKADVMARK